MAVRLINIEHGYPKVEEAIKKLKFELSTLRQTKVRTVKVIHGYGSSGTGGSIRQATRRYLSEQQQSGRIKAFAPAKVSAPLKRPVVKCWNWIPVCAKTLIGIDKMMALPSFCFVNDRKAKCRHLKCRLWYNGFCRLHQQLKENR